MVYVSVAFSFLPPDLSIFERFELIVLPRNVCAKTVLVANCH